MNYIFSWAENAEGKLVHVDSVPRGLECGCVCPYCHERLLARHGDVREHGFAHHSETRQATLDICYKVVLYKLAEQIVQEKKCIHAPSYYGIHKETDIEFVDVKVDSRYEREDKQPDVIGTTKDGSQYLIEFIFDYKVQHKLPIDYKNLTCLEIDLSSQTLETLENFLLTSNENKKWVNNEIYFGKIEEIYRKGNKPIKVVPIVDCYSCEIRNYSCCAVKSLYIENNGQTYRLCKVEQYQKVFAKYKEQENLLEEQIMERAKHAKEEELRRTLKKQERSCFNCEKSLGWMNRDHVACCGCYISLGIPKYVHPEYAMQCSTFKNKYYSYLTNTKDEYGTQQKSD